MTTRRVGDTPRTLIVINSMNMELPAHMYPVVPAYEERFLFLMLAAVKNGDDPSRLYCTACFSGRYPMLNDAQCEPEAVKVTR